MVKQLKDKPLQDLIARTIVNDLYKEYSRIPGTMPETLSIAYLYMETTTKTYKQLEPIINEIYDNGTTQQQNYLETVLEIHGYN